MSKHDHSECDHDMRYCKPCDAAYCKKCYREWPAQRPYWGGSIYTYPTTYTISGGVGTGTTT